MIEIKVYASYCRSNYGTEDHGGNTKRHQPASKADRNSSKFRCRQPARSSPMLFAVKKSVPVPRNAAGFVAAAM